MKRAPIGALFISLALLRSGGGDLAGVRVDDLCGLVLLRPGGGAAAAGGLLQPVAVAIHRQDADVVSKPVEQRAGEPLRAEHLVQSSNGRLEVMMVDPRS